MAANSYPCFGIGALGSTTGGTFASGTYGKGYGQATLTGTAYNSVGTKFVVLPGVTIWYDGTIHSGGGGSF